MTVSPLATGERLALGFYHSGGQKLRRYMPRNGRIQGMIFHHIVGNVDSLQRELLKPTRTLSVNYGIARDGTIHPCVSESLKANTTSHAADHTHITVETANESLAPSYRISDASFYAAARLAADCGHRHGFVPSASTIRFHRQFIATECPGPDFWSRRIEFIALARQYYYNGASVTPTPAPTPDPPKEDSMSAQEVNEIKAHIDQSMEIIRRESRPRVYEKESTGELLLARVDTGFVRGPYKAEGELSAGAVMRNDLPVNGEHLVNVQEFQRRLFLSDAEWDKLLSEFDR